MLFTNATRFVGFTILLLTAYPSSSALAHTQDEENTIRVYDKAKATVVNITSRSVSYDFFMTPIPKEGSGSGGIRVIKKS